MIIQIRKAKKKGKKKDNNLKWKDLIFGVDIFFKNKIIYIFFHIINVLALILELIFSLMVEISDNPIWLFLQGRTYFISCCEFFAIIVVNFIDELIDKYM